MYKKYHVHHNCGLTGYIKYSLKEAYFGLPGWFYTVRQNRIPMCFIVGCGHSGTTLLAAKLGNHKDVLAIGRETSIFAPSYESMQGARRIIDEWQYFAELGGKALIVEKTPKHVYAYDRIKKVTPDSKVIVMVRNPLDTIASLYKRFDDLDFSIERWIFDNEKALSLRAREDVMFMRYEDLTRSPVDEIGRLLTFLGLAHDGDLLSGGETVFSKTTQEGNMALRREQVEAPIRANEGGWKKVFSEQQAALIRKRVASVSARLGYDEAVTAG